MNPPYTGPPTDPSSQGSSTTTYLSSTIKITPLEASFVILGLLGLAGINILIKRKE